VGCGHALGLVVWSRVQGSHACGVLLYSSTCPLTQTHKPPVPTRTHPTTQLRGGPRLCQAEQLQPPLRHGVAAGGAHQPRQRQPARRACGPDVGGQVLPDLHALGIHGGSGGVGTWGYLGVLGGTWGCLGYWGGRSTGAGRCFGLHGVLSAALLTLFHHRLTLPNLNTHSLPPTPTPTPTSIPPE